MYYKQKIWTDQEREALRIIKDKFTKNSRALERIKVMTTPIKKKVTPSKWHLNFAGTYWVAPIFMK